MKTRDQEAWGLSADDSIEIEFPSLKHSAPKLVERVESKRAPGPIEAQLSGSADDDDLSWLTAIFANEEDDEEDDEEGDEEGDEEDDEEGDEYADDDGDDQKGATPASRVGVPVEVDPETDAGSTDPGHSAAPGTPADTWADTWPDLARAEPPMVLAGLPDDLSDEAAERSKGGLNGARRNDLPPPPVRPYVIGETADDTAYAIDDPANFDSAPVGTEGDPLATGSDDPEAPSRSKQATGFREEIMSTFSQMYN